MLRKLLLLVMAVSAIAAAEISLGVDMRYLVSKDEDEREYSSESANEEQEYGSNSLSIIPVLGIHANDIIEISPFFGYHFHSSKTKSKTSTSTSKSKRSQHGIEPGLGLYFHLINNSDIIDFSLGPKISYGINFPPNTERTVLNMIHTLMESLVLPARSILIFTSQVILLHACLPACTASALIIRKQKWRIQMLLRKR